MSRITIEELSKRAIQRPGVDLYTVEDALVLVKLCQQASTPILGIDAFIIYADKVQPSLENSIDLSFVNNCYDVATRFLTDRYNLNFVYEIVY